MVYLDDLDWKIIRELRKNGRQPNSSIAKTLDVTEGTIRQRVKKLLDSGILKISGLINPELLGRHATGQ